MQAPQRSGSYFYNYKGTHSVVLLALADAHMRFLYVDAGCNGRISDGGVFANSVLSEALELNTWQFPSTAFLPGGQSMVPYVVVADEAFPLRNNLLKPFPFRNLSAPERVFNYRLSRARRIVENAFGLLANVFRIFRKPILLGAEKTTQIALATCALHNFLLRNKEARSIYMEQGDIDKEQRCDVASSSFYSLSQQGPNFSSQSARAIRDEYKMYFISHEGEVEWQYRYI